MPPLKNQRQELFCQEYLLRPVSPGACAVVAGYSVKTAPQIASRLLTYVNVQSRIAELNERAAAKRVMTVQERLERLSEVGRADLMDFVGNDGEPIPDIKKAPNTRAIAEYSISTTYTKKGDTVVTKTVKLINPISGIQELNKMTGTYKEPDSQTNNLQINIIVQTPQAQDLLRRTLSGERSEKELPSA